MPSSAGSTVLPSKTVYSALILHSPRNRVSRQVEAQLLLQIVHGVPSPAQAQIQAAQCKTGKLPMAGAPLVHRPVKALLQRNSPRPSKVAA